MISKFNELFSEVNREGMQEFGEWLVDTEFFKTPASTRYHLAEEGGLLEHSINVCNTALSINTALGEPVERESIIITSLFHDLGKHQYYGKPYYKDKFLKSGKKGVQPYESNKDLMHVPHEIISIQVLSQFITLTEEENFAILYHNGMYGPLKYELQGKETPLYLILHFADMWASRVMEV